MRATTTKSSTRMHFMDMYFVQWQTGGFGGRGNRSFAILRTNPDFEFVRGEERSCCLRLHSCMVHEAGGVFGFQYRVCRGERLVCITVLACNRSNGRFQAFAQVGHDGLAGDFALAAVFPFNLNRLEGFIRLPPVAGNDRNPFFGSDDLLHARHGLSFAVVVIFYEAAKHGTLQDRRMQHAG